MADEPQTAPQPNEPEARTPTGELKDQGQQFSPDPAAKPELSQTQANPADTESKPAGETLANDKKPTETKAEVPAEYKFTAPEGFEYNPERLAEITPVFKELGLSQDQAQKLMDVAGKQLAAAQEAPFEFYQNQRNEWRQSLIADKTYGNGKDNLNDATRADIGRVIDSLGAELAPQFREAMDYTGVGDHPAFVKAMVSLSKLVIEGKPTTGTPPKSGEKAPTAAQAMYPHLPSAAG